MSLFMIKTVAKSDIVHFIGIGGIGMSGIAEILHDMGYKVQGSDGSENANVKRLKSLGIKINIGQSARNIEGVALIVKSSAIKDDNPEIVAAAKSDTKVILRAEMLAYIMKSYSCVSVAGTHGKTTTTSMVTAVFESASMRPTFINGGIVNSYGTNAKIGSGEWLIAEADESDGTFIKLPAKIGIITNIDPEHMEHYGSFGSLKKCFQQFIEQLEGGGFGVLCKDHDVVRQLEGEISGKDVVTYGVSVPSDVMAKNIIKHASGSIFDIEISDNMPNGKRTIKNVELPMPGAHNILNGLAAIAVGVKLGFSDGDIQKSFSGFKGVKRRFTKVGESGGIIIIDDYAHHPKEVAVTLDTARSVVESSGGKVIAVFQPHKYSRIADLFEDFCKCFAAADRVIVTDIFEAGEPPIDGISKYSIVKGIADNSNKNVECLDSDDHFAESILKTAKSGDIVVCMGAGNISLMANELPKQMEKIKVVQ